MLAEPTPDTFKTITQRIDAMIDELIELRQSVQALGQKVNSQAKIEEKQIYSKKQSALDILSQERTFSMFQSAQEVDDYLREERSSWDD